MGRSSYLDNPNDINSTVAIKYAQVTNWDGVSLIINGKVYMNPELEASTHALLEKIRKYNTQDHFNALVHLSGKNLNINWNEVQQSSVRAIRELENKVLKEHSRYPSQFQYSMLTAEIVGWGSNYYFHAAPLTDSRTVMVKLNQDGEYVDKDQQIHDHVIQKYRLNVQLADASTQGELKVAIYDPVATEIIGLNMQHNLT